MWTKTSVSESNGAFFDNRHKFMSALVALGFAEIRQPKLVTQLFTRG